MTTPRARLAISFRTVLPATAGLLLVAGCASGRPADAPTADAPTADSHLARVLEQGKLEMIAFPHQESHFVHADLSLGPMPAYGPDRHWAGIDVEIMRRFAAELGVELWIRRVSEPSYGALIPDLLAGKGDLVASSLTMTPTRQAAVDFSRPYFTIYQVVIAPQGSALAGPEDLAGKVGAVIPGSSHEERLLALGVPREQHFHTAFMLENYIAVDEGDADFALVDSGSAERVLPKMKSLEIAFRLPGEEHYGIALPPGSDLKPRLDAFLEKLEASGELAEIVAAAKLP